MSPIRVKPSLLEMSPTRLRGHQLWSVCSDCDFTGSHMVGRDFLRRLAKAVDRFSNPLVSVTGLMEPPYRYRTYGYSHLAITITQPNQIHLISESQAKYRLGGAAPEQDAPAPERRNNEDILREMRGGANTGRTGVPPRGHSLRIKRFFGQWGLANRHRSKGRKRHIRRHKVPEASPLRAAVASLLLPSMAQMPARPITFVRGATGLSHTRP